MSKITILRILVTFGSLPVQFLLRWPQWPITQFTLNIWMHLVTQYIGLSKQKIDLKKSKMAADKVWVEESNILDLSEPAEFKIWLEHLDDPLVLLNTRDHLYNCFNLTYEQPSEGHPKNVKGGET